jgi:hypothetical protein
MLGDFKKLLLAILSILYFSPLFAGECDPFILLSLSSRENIEEYLRAEKISTSAVVSSFPCPASMQLWTRNCGLLAV